MKRSVFFLLMLAVAILSGCSGSARGLVNNEQFNNELIELHELKGFHLAVQEKSTNFAPTETSDGDVFFEKECLFKQAV